MASKVLEKAKQRLEEELDENERVIIARFKRLTGDWKTPVKGFSEEYKQTLLDMFLKGKNK